MLSVTNLADLLQLPVVRGKLIFLRFSDNNSVRKQLLGLQLCHLFKYAELTEAVRQNHRLFIKLLKKVWVGKIDDDVEKLFKAIFIHESDESYATGEQGIMQTKMEVGIRFWVPN